jgi:hypothetical protein
LSAEARFRVKADATKQSILACCAMDCFAQLGARSREQLARNDEVICAVSIPSRKNISLHNSENQKYMNRVHSTEGRFANVTNAGLDAMDAGAQLTRALICGRRSRVVLTPRPWYQVGGCIIR